MIVRWALSLPVTLVIMACSPVPPPETAAAPPNFEQTDPADADEHLLVPVGFGSLRQDDFSVEITDAGIHVKVTPLSETVIRLAAPDTYERLHALAWSRRNAVERALEEGETGQLFLVSFFSRQPNVEYRPEELQITHRGRTVRTAGIIPLTAGWGRHLVQPQQAQSAIYVFAAEFDYGLPITFRYGLRQSDDWHREVLPRLDDERTRVLARAQARP